MGGPAYRRGTRQGGRSLLSDAIPSRADVALDQPRLAAALAAAAVVIAVFALFLPVFQAGPAPLTSDESLYLSEAYNIAEGHGPRYTSGELVHHRAPLFPALLAAPIRLAGGDAGAAYWAPKLVMLALVVATFLLARQLFGTMAGALSALLVASSAFLRWLGATLFLDGAETLFLLLSLSALWQGLRREKSGWFALSGLLFGAAFLTKEAAIQWLPLPFAFVLLSPQFRTGPVARGLAAFAAAAGATLAAWWAWVYAVTGQVYFWGPPDARLFVLLTIATSPVVATGAVWLALRRVAPDRLRLAAQGAGVALAAGWAPLMLFFLEATSWPFPNDHWRNVPSYLWQVAASNSQPWPLVTLGGLWLVARAPRQDAPRLLALALLFFAPFAIFVANRSFAYRDFLPMLYVAYIGAGAVAAVGLRWAAARAGPGVVALAVVAGLAAFGYAQTGELTNERLPHDEAAVTQANWDNPLARDTAAWLHANVPAGAGVMSSRLYFSQIFVLDGAAHPVYQLPTVRVEPRPGGEPLLFPITTLFRWEDQRLAPAQADQRWLYVRRYPDKGYYVALSEHDLLRDLRERDVDYLVLTGEDAGFSSFTYLDYFDGNPAFELVHSIGPSNGNGVYVYRVDRDWLAPRSYRAVVSAETLEALERETGLSGAALATAIDPDGIVARPARPAGEGLAAPGVGGSPICRAQADC